MHFMQNPDFNNYYDYLFHINCLKTNKQTNTSQLNTKLYLTIIIKTFKDLLTQISYEIDGIQFCSVQDYNKNHEYMHVFKIKKRVLVDN